MSRQIDRALRPSVDGLEKRFMLSAGIQRPAMHAPMPTENLFFGLPSIASQQSSSATVTLNRQAIPNFDRSGMHVIGKGKLDDTLVVHVTTYDPLANANQSGVPIVPGGYATRYDPPANVDQSGPPGTTGATTGMAIPNVHFVPVDETVTFLPGETSKTITVSMIPGAENSGRVSLTLEAASTSGPPLFALTSLVIDARPDAMTPLIVNSQLVVDGKKATGIAIQFNTPMDVASVTNPNAYKVTDHSHQPTKADALKFILTGKIKDYSKPVKIQSATWDASTNTVTLISKGPLMASGHYGVESRRMPRTRAAGFGYMNGDRAAVPLRDQAGNYLNDNGSMGYLLGGISGLSVTRRPNKPFM